MSNTAHLPENAQPGDVVDGHMRTESGRWIPLTDEAHAARYGTDTSGNRPPVAARAGQWALSRFSWRTALAVVALAIGGWQVYPHVMRTAFVGASNRPAAVDAPAPAPLTQEEIDTIDITQAEVFHGHNGARYVLTLEADGLERDFVAADYTVEILAADDTVVGTAAGHIVVGNGWHTYAVGDIEPVGDADPVAEGIAVQTNATAHEWLSDNPGLELVSVELVEAGTAHEASLTLTSQLDVRAAHAAVVVRDVDGQVISAESRPVSGVDAGTEKVVEIRMWDLDELPEGHTVDAVIVPL